MGKGKVSSIRGELQDASSKVSQGSFRGACSLTWQKDAGWKGKPLKVVKEEYAATVKGKEFVKIYEFFHQELRGIV